MMVKRVMNQVQKLDPFYDESFIDHTYRSLKILHLTLYQLMQTLSNPDFYKVWKKKKDYLKFSLFPIRLSVFLAHDMFLSRLSDEKKKSKEKKKTK